MSYTPRWLAWLMGERESPVPARAGISTGLGPNQRYITSDTRTPGLLGQRSDSWQNPYTGLGTDRDKVTQGTYFAPYRLQDAELLALYNGSDIAARICEARPKEMLRRGFNIEVDGDDEVDEEEISELVKYGEKLRAKELLQDAMVWGNLFGGSLLIMGLEDGNIPEEPVNEAAIRSVRYLNVIDRRFVFVHKYYNDPLAPNYGLPEVYLVVTTVGGMQPAPAAVLIHESRILRFDGARTDILTRQQLSGWSWSLLQRAYEPLRAFESGFQAVANLMSDASQAVFKIQDLISMIASGEKDTLQTRMALVDQSRSVCRAVLLDAEKEEFQRQPTTFTGLPDLLDRFMMRLSAACEIPVTILLGRSAAGMNATGDADFRAFYDSVATDQENVLQPKLKRLYHLLALAKDSPCKGEDYEFRVNFHGLWQPSDTEQAKVELDTAQRDQIYATIGAVSPETIALSRWGKKGFVSSGMSAFDPQDAIAAKENDKMFGGMLQPPPELQGQGTQGQGQQQTLATSLPGPNGTGAAGSPGANPMESPYATEAHPVKALAKRSEPDK